MHRDTERTEDRLTFLMPLYACHSLNKLPVLSPVGGFLPSAISGSCRVEAKCFRCCSGPWSGWLDTGRMGTGKKGQWYQGWPRGEAGCLSTSLEFWSHYWSAFLQLCDTRTERTTLLRKPCVAQSSCSHPLDGYIHPLHSARMLALGSVLCLSGKPLKNSPPSQSL